MTSLIEYAVTAMQLGRHDDAARVCQELLEADPDNYDALHVLGVNESVRGNNKEAVAHMERAIAAHPERGQVYQHLAIPLMRLGRLGDALVASQKGIELYPDIAGAFSNNGLMLHMCGRFEEARASYQKATQLDPKFNNAWWNLGINHLTFGNYAEGWPLFECRWGLDILKDEAKKFPSKPWTGGNGESIVGKTVFVQAEQGLGDIIQFARFIPELRKRGAEVIFGTRPALYELMKLSLPDCRIILEGDELPPYDIFTSLECLPLALGCTSLDKIPPPFKFKIPHRIDVVIPERPAIGLVWSGSNARPDLDGLSPYYDGMRSLTLQTLLPLLDIDAMWISLQKDVRDRDEPFLDDHKIADVRHALVDMALTAQIIEQLDLVITCDTSVAHLAASLGIPTWIFIPFVPCWRWMLDREDSPWYPSVRLFRQGHDRSWDTVVQRMCNAIKRKEYECGDAALCA